MATSNRTPIIGIYKIMSPSGRVYIGQSWNIRKRWRGYGKPMEVRRQPIIDSSIRKYGLAAHRFEIVHQLPPDVDQSTLDTHEQYYMDVYRGLGVPLMNIRGAGSRGKLAQETKDKIGAKNRGRKASDITRLRQSLSHKGVKKTEEHKARIGLAHKGREQFVKAFQGGNNIKAKLTPEQVSDIRQKHVRRQPRCNINLAWEYGVSISTIERITGRGKGGTWLHIQPAS